ncbi:MAG: YCF48-related protein, partial [Ignavibacteriae bacterium]|nr:YCF48-related protein [Ignavibacteriota bacterium]
LFLNSNTGWIASDTGIIKTTNSGVNWFVQKSANLISLSFVNINTGWCTGTDGIIQKTTNGGTNWNTQSYVVTNNMLNSIYAVDANNAFIVGWDSTVLSTTNGGNTWNHQYINYWENLFSVFFININTGWIAGASGNIYKTINSGLNWNRYSGGGSSLSSIRFVDMNTGWTAGYPGTLRKSTNGGVNWFSQSSGTTKGINALTFIDVNSGFAVGDSGLILKTSNSGSNWTLLSCGTIENLNSLYFTNTNTGWIVGDNKIIRFTTNAGTNWVIQTCDNINNIIDFKTICFLGNDTGVIGGTYGFIFKTTNRGSNWIGKRRLKDHISSMMFANSKVLWAVGASSIILKNSNAGENQFTDQSGYRNNVNQNIPPFQTIYDSVYINVPANTTIETVNYEIDTVLYSPDSNLVFTLIHAGIYDTLVYQVGGGGSNFIKTKLSDTASISIHNGTPPFTNTYRPYRPLSQFTGTPASGLWILRINSKGTLQRTGVIKSWGITVSYNSFTGIKNITKNIPGSFKLYQNYPNPFNPKTIIKYDLKSNVYVKLRVYDILGREMITLVNGNQNAGTYEYAFDGRDLASSVYFYKLEIIDPTGRAGDFSEVKKMVLIK